MILSSNSAPWQKTLFGVSLLLLSIAFAKLISHHIQSVNIDTTKISEKTTQPCPDGSPRDCRPAGGRM